MFPLSSYVNVFPVPVVDTEYVFVRVAPPGSTAVTVTFCVPPVTATLPTNSFVAVVAAGWPPTVTVAASLVLPSKLRAPPTDRLVNWFAKFTAASVDVLSICSVVRFSALSPRGRTPEGAEGDEGLRATSAVKRVPCPVR
jgi:hypothetical protein